MEYVKGNRVKNIFNNLNQEERQNLCKKIGKSIGYLHKNDIIHGDITTSNMIEKDDRIFFIILALVKKIVKLNQKV